LGNVSFIPTNSTKTIYVYYGDPQTTTQTFIYGDDLSTDTLANYSILYGVATTDYSTQKDI